MLIGYARVSTQDQNLDLQKDALHKAGCEQIYEDRVSGTKARRPGLEQAFSHLREGDTFVVWRLDRLGRSLRHLIDTVTELQEKGIGFKSLTENIDTTTTGGRLVFNIFSSLAQFEAEIIRERTLAGLQAARARGRRGGPKHKLTDEQVQMAQTLYDTQMPVNEICNTLGISRSTFYRYVKANNDSTEFQVAPDSTGNTP
jgi:DNA invertase Pin-like site-specific DNA recombinase